MEGRDEAARREAIRVKGKHVPRRIELGAWMALVAALVSFVARMGLEGYGARSANHMR
jgi:hypothetical protein